MSNNRKKTGGSSTRSKSATSKTISIRLSLHDLDMLRSSAEARGLSIGHYARLVLVDHIRPAINFLSFLFSAVMGIVFGYYPAARASRLDPIDALRHE